MDTEFDLASLGYLGVASEALDHWRAFAVDCLGMQLAERSNGRVSFRMDERPQRLIIDSGLSEARYTIGWEAVSAAALDRLGARLERAGIEVIHATQAMAAARYVGELIAFRDPAGNNIEVFLHPEKHSAPFVPGRTHSGFRTGSLGFGHVVLTAPSLEALLPFYRDLLGFRISDYQLSPFPAYFFHVNKRHHSLALIQLPQPGVHHVMIEHTMLDDVGQGLDVIAASEHRIGVTLGRHSNDQMTSFYTHTPSAFMVEVGWGGREIDPASWQPVELAYGPSLWGHDRSWLSPEQLAASKRMRMAAAASGFQAPVNVLPGRYRVGDEG